MTLLKNQLVLLLEEIDGVSHKPWPSRDDGFSTLHFHDKEIGHFHHFNELDLKLGKKLILEEGLIHPENSTKHPKRSPNSSYIELRFTDQAAIEQIELLVRRLVTAAA